MNALRHLFCIPHKQFKCTMKQCWLFSILCAIIIVKSQASSATEVWCGKAYKSSDESFYPGGWLDEPQESDVLLINVRAYPRMNIYLEDEDQATLIIDTETGYQVGVPICSSLENGKPDSPFLEVTAHWKEDDGVKRPSQEAVASTQIPVNSTANEIVISIASLPPRFEAYELEVNLKAPRCSQSFNRNVRIYRLPSRTDGGSVTKLDYLYGGIYIQEAGSWKPIFPFGFYVSWGDYLKFPDNQRHYDSFPYNIGSPVPGGGDVPFERDDFAAYIQKQDTLQPSVMYNMRWTYKNETLVSSQIEELKQHKAILLWYTADEPGGQGDPLDAPLQAYNVIKQLDPYHPVSLVLNCANFHYDKYTRGADIILTDPYPIAVNTSWSSRWDTVCNTTYGCCGCDNCHGSFRDVSDRLDNFKRYQHWLSDAPLGEPSNDPGRSAGGPKSFWGVPQVFGGSEYWTRPPTAEEETVMIWLFINHGAKGILGWLFPTTPELTSATAALAEIVTSREVTGLLLGDNPRRLRVEVDAGVDIDAAAWIVGPSMLISIVHLGLEDTRSPVVVKLPKEVRANSVKQLWPKSSLSHQAMRDEAIGQVVLETEARNLPWGDEQSHLSWWINGSEAKSLGLPAMSVTIMIVDLEP